MDTTPSRSRSRGQFQNRRGRGSRPQRLQGLFADGIWLCDCQPERLPASHFRVKKEGTNQGRWFYTCQKEAEKRCGFFLWEDDAKMREEGAVLGNSRTEPRHAQKDGTESWRTGAADEGRASKRPKVDAEAPQSRPSWPSRTSTDSSLDGAMANAASKVEVAARLPETPKKPSALAIAGGLSTPVTGTTTGANTSSKRKFIDLTDGTGQPSDPTTPTPARHTNRLSAPPQPDLRTSFFASLSRHGVKLPPNAQAEISALCTTATMRLRGVEKGREIARLALKAGDARVMELTLKVEALQAELEGSRAIVRAMRGGLGRKALDCG